MISDSGDNAIGICPVGVDEICVVVGRAASQSALFGFSPGHERKKIIMTVLFQKLSGSITVIPTGKLFRHEADRMKILEKKFCAISNYFSHGNHALGTFTYRFQNYSLQYHFIVMIIKLFI